MEQKVKEEIASHKKNYTPKPESDKPIERSNVYIKRNKEYLFKSGVQFKID